MFERIKARFNDMGTIKALCLAAETHALADEQREPGAEHFLLAALDLPDGTAKRAFEEAGSEAGADASTLRHAIDRQYGEALRAIGLESETAAAGTADASPSRPLNARSGLYVASASGREVMQQLAANRAAHAPLLGVHVVAIVAAMDHGVAARALRAMGIDRNTLKAAAERIARNSTSNSAS